MTEALNHYPQLTEVEAEAMLEVGYITLPEYWLHNLGLHTLALLCEVPCL